MNKYGAYRNRDEKLKALGYASYAEYLASPRWAKIRARVLRAARHKCCVCRGKATQVHHRAYTWRALRGQSITALRAVCAACHEHAEWRGSTKATLREANRVIPSRFNICGHCRKNPTKRGHKLCGKCKRTARQEER